MKVYDPNDPLDQERIKRRYEREVTWRALRALVWVVFVIAFGLTVDLVGNQWWYGDWRCAFVNCVRVQDIKKP